MSTPSQRPLSASALRGAVDLSGLKQRAVPSAAGAAPGGTAPGDAASGAAGGGDPLLVEVTDATFSEAVTATMQVPAILAVWAARVPGSDGYIPTLVSLARGLQGRLRVLSLDLDANPGAAQALTPILQQAFGQISAMPVVMALVQGQPMPLFQGPVPEDQVKQVLDQVLEAAVANGVTGRVDLPDTDAGAAEDSDAPAEPEVAPEYETAFEAIERADWDAAIAAYESLLAQNPAEEEARLGLAQVHLMRRVDGQDLEAARAAASEAPDDVAAQTRAADVEMLSGLVEEAFARLVDVVRRTAGAERSSAREHLVGLFDLVGAQDPRVVAARRDLMSALF